MANESNLKGGKRGPAKPKEPTIISELSDDQAADLITMPRAQFKREVKAGEWDGTFRVKGGVKKFFVHLIMDRQRQMALDAIAVKPVRRIAA